jgi:hypothetical protein
MDDKLFTDRYITYNALAALESLLALIATASPLLEMRPSDEATDDLGRVMDEWRERHNLTAGAVLVGTMMFLHFVIHAVMDGAQKPPEVMEGE